MFDFRAHNPFAARKLGASRPLGGIGPDHREGEGHPPSETPQSPGTPQTKSSVTTDIREDLTGPTAVSKGRYPIGRHLSVSAVRDVCLAEDDATRQQVAISVLSRWLAHV